MRNYIRAELRRNLGRFYYIGLTLSLVILAIFVNVMNSKFGPGGSLDFSLQILPSFFGFPIFLIIIFVDMVTMEEFKNGTIKNIVASGLSRDKIVVSKIIVSCLLGLVAALAVIGCYLLSSYMLLPSSPASAGLLKEILLKILAIIPLWFACVAVMTFFALLIDRPFVAGFVYYLAVVALPGGLKFISFISKNPVFVEMGNKYLLDPNIGQILSTTNIGQDYKFGILIGLVYVLVFTGLGVLAFRKRDI